MRIDIISKDKQLPAYATAGSAGMDLQACIAEPIVIKPAQTALIPTGISIALPEGYEAQIRPRSGLALKHGVTVLNSPGTIDSDYRGEIGVIMINHGGQDFTIERGMRIAQMVIAPVIKVEWNLRNDFTDDSTRGDGGFGSTGV